MNEITPAPTELNNPLKESSNGPRATTIQVPLFVPTLNPAGTSASGAPTSITALASSTTRSSSNNSSPVRLVLLSRKDGGLVDARWAAELDRDEAGVAPVA